MVHVVLSGSWTLVLKIFLRWSTEACTCAAALSLWGVWLRRLQAARRRAVTELLFFASVGDLKRCQRIVRLWNLQVSSHMCTWRPPLALHLVAAHFSAFATMYPCIRYDDQQ